ncbi:benzoyl-coa reductase subunit badg [hydrocarbon metagenome]|uniref:Benzoyl-coa reductase subunit badg n=1 Tax=hydrocarbon metagenome TaxID=938273 RepID=A0A0W8E9M0_9ZZZZ
MVGIGLDIGSTASKGVLIKNDHKHYCEIMPTGWSPRDAAGQLIEKLLDNAGLDRSDINRIYATGYGRIAISDVDKTLTEIKCHARGVSILHPEVRTIIDIGGQDSKVIKVNENGQVVDFAMNDKCAAGTGRFLQVTANALGMDVSELAFAEDRSQIISINSMCTVFAESEIIGLIAGGISRNGVIAGLHQSVGKRVAAMARRLGIQEKVAFTGGVAINNGVRRALGEELGCEIIIPDLCQYTGALGAALLACEQ